MITKVARQPNATASSGISRGLAIAPRLAPAFMKPSASERCESLNQTLIVLTAAGVLAASAAPSTTRAITKSATLRAIACAMAAALHTATAIA